MCICFTHYHHGTSSRHSKFHPDQFKVYNLCSERKYKAERFDHMVCMCVCVDFS
jgi:hypothetical protein